MENFEKQKELEILKQQVLNCNKCDLHKTRINPVDGEGSLNSEIMFIGEAPGFNEDKQGKPFVGQAGKIFDELLNSASLKREEVYITNILKCHPPQNRNPTQEEIKRRAADIKAANEAARLDCNRLDHLLEEPGEPVPGYVPRTFRVSDSWG